MSAEVKEKLVGVEKQESATLKSIVCDIRLLLIGLWLGAAVFFSFAVAPVAFRTLQDREMAGAIVQRTLAIITRGSFWIGLLLIVSGFFYYKRIALKKFVAEIASLILLVASSILQFAIMVKMDGLREQIARPIDELAQTDPLRVAFNSLHGYSVIVLTVGMIAAVVAFLLIARRRQA